MDQLEGQVWRLEQLVRQAAAERDSAERELHAEQHVAALYRAGIMRASATLRNAFDVRDERSLRAAMSRALGELSEVGK